MYSEKQVAGFAAREVLAQSWPPFLSRFGPLFAAHAVFNLVVSTAMTTLCGFGGILLAGPMWFGVCRLALNTVRNASTPYEDMFSGLRVFGPACRIGVWIIGMAAMGAFLFWIPAGAVAYRAFVFRSESSFIWAVSIGGTLGLLPLCAMAVVYAPAFFFLCDDAADARQALRESRRMVCRNPRAWLRLWAAFSVLHLAGLLTCCTGLFVVTPWMAVALALAYEHERPARLRLAGKNTQGMDPQ